AQAPMSFLLSGLSIGGQCDMNFKQAKDQRLHVELCLMKLASLRDLLNWEAMPEPAVTNRSSATPPATNGIAISAENGAEKKNGQSPSNGAQPDNAVEETPEIIQSVADTDVPETDPAGPASAETPPFTSEPVGNYQAVARPAASRPAIPPLPPRTAAPATGAPLPATSRLRSTVGIGAKPQAVETEVTVVTGERPSQPFTVIALQSAWKAFAVHRRQQTDNATEQIILNRDFTLDGYTISLNLDNHIQADLFVSMLPDLLAHLRQNLQNWQIQIEHAVVMAEIKKMIYSPQDKFNYLAEKNPALHKLRQALGMEVDY
ncbi:MAG: DNA polymerase III subunit gamma/tau, partial [Cytophagaceae bacterium]